MESGLALRPQDLCSDRLWGTALSCPFHVSVGQPLGKQPLGLLPPSSLACSPLWEKRCMDQLVCVSVLSGGFPPYTHTLYCHHSLPPCTVCPYATSAFSGVFLLEFLEAGTGAHKMSVRGGRKELREGSPTARACEGLQGSGWKLKEHSRWVRLKKRSGASECVVMRGG